MHCARLRESRAKRLQRLCIPQTTSCGSPGAAGTAALSQQNEGIEFGITQIPTDLAVAPMNNPRGLVKTPIAYLPSVSRNDFSRYRLSGECWHVGIFALSPAAGRNLPLAHPWTVSGGSPRGAAPLLPCPYAWACSLHRHCLSGWRRERVKQGIFLQIHIKLC